MAHLQWILFSTINLFGFLLHSIILLHYSLLLRDLLRDSQPQFPANEDYRRIHLLLIHRSLSWNTSYATNVSFGMDGATSPHLFTRGCTPGIGIKLLKTLWIRISSKRRKSYQESKGFVIWLPFHQQLLWAVASGFYISNHWGFHHWKRNENLYVNQRKYLLEFWLGY